MFSRFKHYAAVTCTVLRKRFLAMLFFAVLMGFLGFLIDRWSYDRSDVSRFVDYYEFQVNNGREGEDVFYKLCRRHDENYNYTGTLAISILPDTNDPTKNVNVYSQSLSDTLRPGECENRAVTDRDYHHNPGYYTMSFCITFKVKYGFEKRACKESNVYRVVPDPANVEEQIRRLQEQIDQWRALQVTGTEGVAESINTQAPSGPPSTPAKNTAAAPPSASPQPGPQPSAPPANNPPSPPATRRGLVFDTLNTAIMSLDALTDTILGD